MTLFAKLAKTNSCSHIKFRLLSVILSSMMLFSSGLANAWTKRALVIGIGEQEDRSWAKINGDKDVSYVQDMLSKYGYNDVITLVNEQATKKAIVLSFQKLTAVCNPGDIVYIHFSGHGQQVTDVNGDETDGWDEAWIPYDAYLTYDERLYKGENHLVDDELNTLLTSVRNKIGDSGKMLVVVDACHSGDSVRGSDIDETVRGVKDEFVIPVKKRGTDTKAPEMWLTLSACKDYQLNQEMKTPQVGKLTYALYSLSRERNVTFETVQDFMKRHRGQFAQTPVLTGDTITNKISDFLK